MITSISIIITAEWNAEIFGVFFAIFERDYNPPCCLKSDLSNLDSVEVDKNQKKIKLMDRSIDNKAFLNETYQFWSER